MDFARKLVKEWLCVDVEWFNFKHAVKTLKLSKIKKATHSFHVKLFVISEVKKVGVGGKRLKCG